MWLRHNRNLFPTVLEAGKSKVKALADSLLGEDLLPVSQTAVLSLCPHVEGGEWELLGSFMRTLIPFMVALLS